MSDLVLSPRQSYAIRQAASTYKYIVLFGPVRSAKTFSAFEGFLQRLCRGFAGMRACMYAKDLDALKVTLLPELEFWGERYNVDIKQKQGEFFEIPSLIGRPNRLYHRVVGQGEERAYGKLKGPTFCMALADEFNEMPETALTQIKNRIALEPGSQLWCTGNPKSSGHWGKIEWADKCDNDPTFNGIHIAFSLFDNGLYHANPAARESMMDTVKSYHPDSVEFKRDILGQHVDASGLVHPTLDRMWINNSDMSMPDYWVVGMDPAALGKNAACLIAVYPWGWHIWDTWFYDHSNKGYKDENWKAQQLLEWVAGRDVRMWAFPRDAKGIAEVISSKLPVNDRNRVFWPCSGDEDHAGRAGTVNRRLYGTDPRPGDESRDPRHLTMSQECKRLRREWGSMVWGPDGNPDKDTGYGAHLSDSVEYAMQTHQDIERGMQVGVMS